MTVYSNKNRRGREPSDTPIVASYDTNEHKDFVCSLCNRTMVRLWDSSRENPGYFCSTCQTETSPEEIDNLRTRARLQMPEGVNTNPVASTKFPEPTVGRSPPPIRGTFAELQRRGINIKNYKDEVKG